jgi:peptide/nickel transport system permease protein
MKLVFSKPMFSPGGTAGRPAVQKFRKNRIAMLMMAFILLLTVVAVLGYLITPDQSRFANQQYPELAARKPGFKIRMISLCKNESSEKSNFISTMFYGKKSRYSDIPVYSLDFSGDYVIYEEYTGDTPNDGAIKKFHLVDAVYPLTPGQNPPVSENGYFQFTDVNGKNHEVATDALRQQFTENQTGFKRFILGTDRYGRDLLSQLMIGSRVSLSVGLISVLISLVLGIFMGALAGYFRGWVDQLVMWIINVVWSIPTLLLVIAISFALGKGFWQVFVAVGLTMWVEVARVVRGQILSVREKEYVEAARAMGFGHPRIIFRHILPNVMAPVIVISAANFASAILIESGLSFLGIGVQPPMPSWGTMIREHYGYIILDSAYLAILPGLAIMITVLAFMVMGNALRDAMDVKTVNR